MNVSLSSAEISNSPKTTAVSSTSTISSPLDSRVGDIWDALDSFSGNSPTVASVKSTAPNKTSSMDDPFSFTTTDIKSSTTRAILFYEQ